MKKVSMFFFVIFGTLVFSGCSYNAPCYKTDSCNVQALKCDCGKGHAINVACFTACASASGDEWCRLSIPVKTPTNVPYYEYIHNALVMDLSQAGLYSDCAARTLRANLDQMDLNTTVSGGTWKIKMTFNDGKHCPFTICDEYCFSVKCDSDSVCATAADALTQAVQKFLLKVYRSPEFKRAICN